MDRRWLVRQLFWAVPLLIGVSFLARWLLGLGSKSGAITDSLSLVVSILNLAVSVLAFLYTVGARPDPVEHEQSVDCRRRPRPLVLAALVVFCGGVLGLLFWQLIHKPDVQATELVKVLSGDKLADGSQAMLVVPGTPPQRRYLSMTPLLDNIGPTGDCEGASRLAFTRIIDGRKESPLTDVVSRTEVILDLGAATQSARVLVDLSADDPECRVELLIQEAVLFNTSAFD